MGLSKIVGFWMDYYITVNIMAGVVHSEFLKKKRIENKRKGKKRKKATLWDLNWEGNFVESDKEIWKGMLL